MADLPEDRLAESPPFTYCGVDYFGPFVVKEGHKEVKRWGVLFCCLAGKAIHIETSISLSTDSFINALRRFQAVRGPIRLLRSDQGTNFIGAHSELKESLEKMDLNKVGEFLLKKNCDYFPVKFNAPSASHTGGIWERQIRSISRILSSLLADFGSQLNDESLRTFLCEAASIINSRPLSIDSLGDVKSFTSLSPNTLLTMKPSVLLPPPGEFLREDIYSRKIRCRVQYIANQFWLRFRQEYIQNLQLRQKWLRPRRNLKENDLVLVKDDNLPRCQWHLAKVCDAPPALDGFIRRVRIQLGDRQMDCNGKRVTDLTTLERPVQKLVLVLSAD